jgi:hypothetical protein
MREPEVLQESPDFSLVLGDPLFQLFRRTSLSGDRLEWTNRRILVILLVAWLPLLHRSIKVCGTEPVTVTTENNETVIRWPGAPGKIEIVVEGQH